ncbi:hypothetical protein V494_04123, partial [Pseudogymnoascus sp. VKM F-4513 (FW-928)]
RADVLQSNLNYVEHALAGVKATSSNLEKAVLKERRRNEFLKIENSRLEKGLRDVMSAKRGSTEGSEKDEPRRSGFIWVEVQCVEDYGMGDHWVEDHWVGDHWVGDHWVGDQWVEDHWVEGYWVDGPIPALKSAAPFEEENNLILVTDPIETSVGSSSARIGREILRWDVLILKHLPAIEFGSTRSQSTQWSQ